MENGKRIVICLDGTWQIPLPQFQYRFLRLQSENREPHRAEFFLFRRDRRRGGDSRFRWEPSLSIWARRRRRSDFKHPHGLGTGIPYRGGHGFQPMSRVWLDVSDRRAESHRDRANEFGRIDRGPRQLRNGPLRVQLRRDQLGHRSASRPRPGRRRDLRARPAWVRRFPLPRGDLRRRIRVGKHLRLECVIALKDPDGFRRVPTVPIRLRGTHSRIEWYRSRSA